MLPYQLLALVFLVHFSESQVHLYQVNRSGILCPADESVYICQNYGTPSIFWRFKLANKLIADFNFNINFDSVGIPVKQTVSSTNIEAEILCGNSSYIMSSLRITITAEANLSKVICSRMEKELILPNYEALLPTSLRMSSIGHISNEEVNVTLIWSSPSRSPDVPFTVSVSPPPLNGIALWVVNDSFTTLHLRNNTLYAINISICYSMPYTSQFTVGRCPFLTDSVVQTIAYYTITSTDAMTASLTCSSNEIYYITACGTNGQWNTSASDVCSYLPKQNNTSTDIYGITTTPPPTTIITTVVDNNIPMLAGITVGTSVLGFTIGTIFGIVCTILKVRNSSKVLTLPSQSLDKNQPSNIPVYEEVELNEIDVSRNIAYADVMNILSA